MSIVTVESVRRDGKYMVRLEFPGAPNAFGGHYPARIFRKIMTMNTLVETCSRPGVDAVHYGVAANVQPIVDEAKRLARIAAMPSFDNGSQ